MARSDQLKQLFAAYSRADDASFREVAGLIISDERRRGHRLLASDLEHALHRDAPSMTEGALSLRPLPKGRDDRPLLTLTKPAHELSDLVLAADTVTAIGEIVEENRSRSLLASFRLLPRRRLLFIGDPGTGKTASAHAIAAELSLPVASVALAALMSSYLGETAKNVEAVVHFAELTPCVLVFDEFESVAAERGAGNDHAELRRVMATVLQLIEGTGGESVVVATSNHPGLLDNAIWRRFDDVISFEPLNIAGVEALLRLRLQGAPHRLGLRKWATKLKEFTPAEVELIALDAQRRWVLSGAKLLGDEHLVAAFERRRRATPTAQMPNPPTKKVNRS